MDISRIASASGGLPISDTVRSLGRTSVRVALTKTAVDTISSSLPSHVYGGAVNLASRISGLSEPGEVLVSDIVRGLARTSAGVRFEDRGEQSLKGVGEPVRVWVVRSDR